MWAKVVAFVAGGFAALWIALPSELQTLGYFMAVDVVTGAACGLRGHRFASSTMGKGLYRKLAEGGIAVTAIILHNEVGLSAGVTSLVIWGLVAKEVASILENAKALGLDTAFLRPLFDRFLTQKIAPADGTSPSATPTNDPTDAEG